MLYRSFLKRIFDISFSIIVLILTLPLIIPITVLLTFSNKGKVFFIQKRPGRNERIFRLIKFKTMNDERDKEGNLLPDEKRLTWVGSIIRRTSVDELPQLFNVLKGDMSLIGPRPLLIEYIPLYNDFQKRRHEVKPGITGWAQVNGRNAISWEDKFKMDVWYVDNISFKLDAKIFFLTIKKIFKREGISSGTSATMEKFSGSN